MLGVRWKAGPPPQRQECLLGGSAGGELWTVQAEPGSSEARVLSLGVWPPGSRKVASLSSTAQGVVRARLLGDGFAVNRLEVWEIWSASQKIGAEGVRSRVQDHGGKWSLQSRWFWAVSATLSWSEEVSPLAWTQWGCTLRTPRCPASSFPPQTVPDSPGRRGAAEAARDLPDMSMWPLRSSPLGVRLQSQPVPPGAWHLPHCLNGSEMNSRQVVVGLGQGEGRQVNFATVTTGLVGTTCWGTLAQKASLICLLSPQPQ